MPPSTPPPVMPNSEVSLGSNIVSVLPSSPPLAMITTRQDQHRDERDDREGEHRADREPNAEVVEDEDDREGDHAPDPPGRPAVGDVRRPEAVDQDAEPEVDAAAAEEQRADEEEAGGEDADPRMGAVGEVLVDRAGAGVLPGVERDRVGDREHAEPGEQHGEGRIPAGADVGTRDAAEDERDGEHRPDRERLGDRVHRREVLLPERPVAASLSAAWLMRSHPPVSFERTPTCVRVAGTIKHSNIECQPSLIPSLDPAGPPSPRALRRRARLRRDPLADRHRGAPARVAPRPGRARGPLRHLARLGARGAAAARGRRARRVRGQPGFFVADSGSTTSASGSRRGSCSSRGSPGSQPRGARSERPRGDARDDRGRAAARTSDAAHDASRAFHVAVAAATGTRRS